MAKTQREVLNLELLSNFVHQIINPLNGVIGTLDNIIDGTVPESRRDQRLRAVRAQLEWSVMLVRNLAYFAKISLTPGTPEVLDTTKTCVIPQLVIEAAQFFQEPGMSKGIQIHLDDRAKQYALQGSPDLLRQVFMNLFDNAVKYSDDNTTITIRAWPQQTTKHLLVEVANTGVGFPHAEASRLFELGYRGHEARARIASGTGIGLYICKLIVEGIHKGTIEAEHSARTRKTVIRLRFPEWRLM